MVFIIYINNLKFFSFYQQFPLVSEKAAHYGHKDIVEFLASNGADIHYKNNHGWTALIWGIY